MAKAKGAVQIFLGTLLSVTCIVAYVAYRTRHVNTPRRPWWRFRRRAAKPLPEQVCQQLQGIYAIENGKELFGKTAVIKYSYTVEHSRTFHNLSFFCANNGLYFICESKSHKSDILLRGVWRRAAANGAGIVQLVVKNYDSDGALLHNENASALFISGYFGFGNAKPNRPLTLRFQQALPVNESFEIIGHRGASRNVDFLPVSENSLEMMKMAARLGATGVEIDVRMTKDGVPVVFHDSFLSVHTVSGKLYGGLLHNYSLTELKKIRLRKGGYTPTLDECLHTVLHKTPLRLVWLDIKRRCDLEPVVRLQQLYLQRAKAIGRNLTIYIGIPDGDVLTCFTALKNYKDIASLVEIDPKLALKLNADAWAPQYVSGFQNANVKRMHEAGKKAFVWSLDNEYLINLYMTRGGFDGVVTNAPTVAAHWWYTKNALQKNTLALKTAEEKSNELESATDKL